MKRLGIRDENSKIEYIDRDRLLNLKGTDCGTIRTNNDVHVASVRISGSFKDHAIYLSPMYEYVLGEDENGIGMLVPMRRKKGDK